MILFFFAILNHPLFTICSYEHVTNQNLIQWVSNEKANTKIFFLLGVLFLPWYCSFWPHCRVFSINDCYFSTSTAEIVNDTNLKLTINPYFISQNDTIKVSRNVWWGRSPRNASTWIRPCSVNLSVFSSGHSKLKKLPVLSNET